MGVLNLQVFIKNNVLSYICVPSKDIRAMQGHSLKSPFLNTEFFKPFKANIYISTQLNANTYCLCTDQLVVQNQASSFEFYLAEACVQHDTL